MIGYDDVGDPVPYQVATDEKPRSWGSDIRGNISRYLSGNRPRGESSFLSIPFLSKRINNEATKSGGYGNTAHGGSPREMRSIQGR